MWGNWGPYHMARFEAFRSLADTHGIDVVGLELFASSPTYGWDRPPTPEGLIRLELAGPDTTFRARQTLGTAVPALWRCRPDIVFVPSYWHWSLVLNATGRMRGAQIVMMNDTHAGTAAATGWRAALKGIIVRRFDGALVAGQPHVRYFSGLGLDESRIICGYDVIDNESFATAAAAARTNAPGVRKRLELPERYVLSLGRLVPKKHLGLLVEAYARLVRSATRTDVASLVIVGSGECESELRARCVEARLPVIDHGVGTNGAASMASDPGVHFYGFRQVDENPSFYALAECFVLPSPEEEWGLVVNEALACGTPAIVARTAGCAEDLVAPWAPDLLVDPHSVDDLARALRPFVLGDAGPGARTPPPELMQSWGVDRFATSAVELTERLVGPSPASHACPENRSARSV